MASFQKAFDYLMQDEGILANSAADKGGMTKYGVTRSTYSFFLNRAASDYDMRAMTLDDAKDVYLKYYWKPLLLDMVIDDGVATAIFDQAVNRGPGTVVEEVQRLVGEKPDGLMGPKTLEAVNNYDSKDLIIHLACLAEYAYKVIVAGNENQRPFLKGWLARAERLKELRGSV